MTQVEPYDYTQLDEIVLFKGQDTEDVIELSREGRYINLIKPNEVDKRYYRFDLKDKVFQRLNFYKTTEDTIKTVDVKNITGWFKDTRIVTKDLHFGRLIIFAKFNSKFSKYRNPVRFIEQLGDKMITSIEQWESLGLGVEEVDYFFGEYLASRSNKDWRKDIYLGEEKCGSWFYKLCYYKSIELAPSDFNKDLLKYITNKYTSVNDVLLTKLYNYYNNGQYLIEQKLKEIGRDPEFAGIFHYTTQYHYSRGRPEERWAFGTSYESRTVRNHLIEVIQTYNLDLIALSRWLKKQKNVDRNDVGYLLGNGNHYADYLRCELDLCDGRLRKMDKYPNNFRTQFHRIEEEYNAKIMDVDESLFERQADKNKGLEHVGRKFEIFIPKRTAEIHNEALELKHCVRSYIPKVINGETLILFLRDKKERDTPLVTLEVKKGALTQAYGKNDSKPPKECLEFLSTWCRIKDIKVGCWRGDILNH